VLITASRGKVTRAAPVSAHSQHGRLHMVGSFPALEDEMCIWEPGDRESPNRLDAMVHAVASFDEIHTNKSLADWGAVG